MVKDVEKCSLYVIKTCSSFGNLKMDAMLNWILKTQGRIQDFKLGGRILKKLRRAKGGAKICGVFRVKNHDFTPKNHIFSNFRGGRAPGAPPSGSAPETEVNIMEVMNGTAKTSADEQMFVDLPTKIVDENINLNRI
jgi:hypothetical protein